MKKVRMPAIVHWETAHFVVLCGFDKKGAVIADPACGRVRISREEFSGAFTGIVMRLEKGEGFVQEANGKRQSFIAGQVWRFIPALTVALLAGGIAAGAQFCAAV